MLEGVRNFVDQLLVGVVDAHKRKSIAFAVAGIIESRSVVCAEIGREAPGDVDDKHKIKRVDRLIGNDRLDVLAICKALLRAFNFSVGQHVLLTLDWTTVGRFEVMTTSVVSGGRAIPFHWTVIHPKKTRKLLAQQCHVEELQELLPDDVNFVLLFDAGYDDVDFVRKVMVDLGLRAIIRSSTMVCIKPTNEAWLNLLSFRFERGKFYDWGTVLFTKEHELPIRCVAIHDHQQQDPWILVTNTTYQAHEAVAFYGRRFETEETYKDYKDLRAGLQLKGSRIKCKDRLKRLIAVQTIAYWLMTLAGMYGESQQMHRRMQANTVRDKRVIAVWRVGRKLIRKGVALPRLLLKLLWGQLSRLAESTGGRLCHR